MAVFEAGAFYSGKSTAARSVSFIADILITTISMYFLGQNRPLAREAPSVPFDRPCEGSGPVEGKPTGRRPIVVDLIGFEVPCSPKMWNDNVNLT